jgi:Spy/CpxP family protein refolding chaperone
MWRPFRMLGFVSVLLTIVAVCATVGAQPPGGRGPGGFGGFGAFGNVMQQAGELFFWARLLRSDKVQKELKLSDDQIAKFKEQDEKTQAKFREMMPSGPEAFAELAKLSDSEKEAKADEYKKKVEKAADEQQDLIEKLLTKAQIDRLEQIGIQVKGAKALNDKEIQEALGLTTKQRDDIKKLRDEETKKRAEIFASGDFRGMRDKLSALQKETDDKVVAVLTDKQKKDFEEFKGTKIEGDPAELMGRGFGGFGGPGGRGPRQ